MSIHEQREAVVEAKKHHIRQLQAPEDLLNAARACTWVTDDENGVWRQLDLATGRLT